MCINNTCTCNCRIKLWMEKGKRDKFLYIKILAILFSWYRFFFYVYDIKGLNVSRSIDKVFQYIQHIQVFDDLLLKNDKWNFTRNRCKSFYRTKHSFELQKKITITSLYQLHNVSKTSFHFIRKIYIEFDFIFKDTLNIRFVVKEN